MDVWKIWVIVGVVCILAEFIVPGGIVIFLGIAAAIVGAAIYAGFITSTISAFITWFIISLALLLFLRSIFIKYFEGDSIIHNVNEDQDNIGKIVIVVEDILPHKEGRISFQGSTWQARSDDELLNGSKASIVSRDGSTWIIRAI